MRIAAGNIDTDLVPIVYSALTISRSFIRDLA
jgi:hypothetical protein